LRADPNTVRQLVRQAGKLAISARKSMTQSLENSTFVTSADQEVEHFLVTEIKKHYPDHSILSEGLGLQGSNEQHVWVIDPIDGTRAFASGLHTWGISVGYFLNRQIKFGIFYMPDVKEMYVGVNERAYLNGKKLPNVLKSLDKNLSTFLAIPSKILSTYDISYPRIRSFGSMAVHLAYVARGIAIGALTRNFWLWDIAGILPILYATGISIEYLDGTMFNADQLLDGSSAPSPCIACHPSMMDKLRKSIRVREGYNSEAL
jgi:fructose-1,6-bisphosphatase/inositol monophosphatase family enzyme